VNIDLNPEPEYSRPAVDAAAQALRNRYGRAVPPVHAAEIMLTAVALVIEAMCRWRPSCGETHEEFHYGNVCPYWAMSLVLQGMDDPRDDSPT
jgi:hypothetical protein